MEMLRPFTRLVLLNSHSHPDHTPNNIIFQNIPADEKAHFMPAESLQDLDFFPSFLKRYKSDGACYDLLDGPCFPYSLAMKPLKLLRGPGLDPFILILKRSLAKFEPFDVGTRPSPLKTARPFRCR